MQDEKRQLEENKVQLLQAQAKSEAVESSIRQEYDQLRGEKVCCLVAIVCILLTRIS